MKLARLAGAKSKVCDAQHFTPSDPGVSIIVCCYNSAARIARTIEHLARQEFTGPWEVILVDNACTDDTVDIAQQTWQQHCAPTQLRIVSEPRAGLSLARNAGVSHARYEDLVFCDDDNWLEADYAERAADILSTRPNVGVVGGYNIPVADVELPPWFPNYSWCYAAGVQAIETGDVTGNYHVWGAGMVLRRSVYVKMQQAGVHSLLVDRRGGQLTSNGDREICLWFIMAGYRLWYDEKLRLRHFMASQRLTPEYLGRMRAGCHESGMVLAAYETVIAATALHRPARRAAKFFSGLARMCMGNRYGRLAAQAYCPLPAIAIDRTTKDIQNIAKKIRRSVRAPSSNIIVDSGRGDDGSISLGFANSGQT